MAWEASTAETSGARLQRREVGLHVWAGLALQNRFLAVPLAPGGLLPVCLGHPLASVTPPCPLPPSSDGILPTCVPITLIIKTQGIWHRGPLEWPPLNLTVCVPRPYFQTRSHFYTVGVRTSGLPHSWLGKLFSQKGFLMNQVNGV